MSLKSSDFQKINPITNVSKLEILKGMSEDHGDFVLMRLPSAIIGVESPSDQVYDDRNKLYDKEPFKGVFKGVFVPGRTVKLSPYYIGKYEVTYKLWKEVYDWNQINNKGYSFGAGWKGSYGDSQNTENDPVTGVSWYDCVVWCNAYTEKEKGIEQCVYVDRDTNQVIKGTDGLTPSKVKYDQSKKGYRLPTEAEWEYAARFHGTDSTNSEKYNHDYLLNTDQLSGGCCNGDNSNSKTHPVEEKAANYAGIFDMSGNVWEWCYDGWEYLVSTGVQTNPIGGSTSADNRAIRGGSWHYGAYNCVVGYRNSRWFSGRYGNVGFRLVYSR